MTGYDIASEYAKGNICGWAEVRQPGIAKEQFHLLNAKGAFIPFKISGQTRETKGTKTFLYQVVRKVLGRDIENIPQEIGDCVSWGARNAVEYLQCCEILLKGDRERYRPVFAPYYYGTGRVYVGGGRLGSSDGSLGSWMAEAVQKYGTLWSDEEGVPAYSGRVAKSFGDPNPRNDLDLFKEKATPYVIQGVALIRTWDEYVAAIANGYTVTIASNVGYDMEPGPDGFHRQRGNWAHQMAGVGADDNDRDPYALIRNSWGDVHGHLKDFETGEDLPEGYLRVRRKDFEKHLRANETFVFSNGKFFPERDIAKELFMLI